MKEVKDMGKCYRKVGNFGLYKDECGFLAVYSVFEDEGKKYANFRGYLANPENFESVVYELKQEDYQEIAELQREFGYA